ncbi:MAG: ABC transporter permease [Alphaproteobacteria bacterium]|nr:ABC transporter permease [Alphaproteobacteria bacterium]
MNRNSRLKFSYFILVFGYTFLFTPIVILIINAFGDTDVPGIWQNLTFKWFYEAIQDHELLQSAITSLKIATISATCSIILGLLATIATTKRNDKFPGKKFLSNAIMIPIVMPEIIVGFSLLMLFLFFEKTLGFSATRGVTTVCIGHVMGTMAYAHMNIRAKLLMIDNSIEESALNLGANPFVVFWQIKLPMLSKAILSSWILAFIMSLDDLVIASFLTGPGATTLPILIFSNIRVGITPVINAFATLFILVIVICIIITHMLSFSNNKK